MPEDQETVAMENGVPLSAGSYSGRFSPCADGKWHYIRITRLETRFEYSVDDGPSTREDVVALLRTD